MNSLYKSIGNIFQGWGRLLLYDYDKDLYIFNDYDYDLYIFNDYDYNLYIFNDYDYNLYIFNDYDYDLYIFNDYDYDYTKLKYLITITIARKCVIVICPKPCRGQYVCCM